jgi:hypothetical protein
MANVVRAWARRTPEADEVFHGCAKVWTAARGQKQERKAPWAAAMTLTSDLGPAQLGCRVGGVGGGSRHDDPPRRRAWFPLGAITGGRAYVLASLLHQVAASLCWPSQLLPLPPLSRFPLFPLPLLPTSPFASSSSTHPTPLPACRLISRPLPAIAPPPGPIVDCGSLSEHHVLVTSTPISSTTHLDSHATDGREPCRAFLACRPSFPRCKHKIRRWSCPWSELPLPVSRPTRPDRSASSWATIQRKRRGRRRSSHPPTPAAVDIRPRHPDPHIQAGHQAGLFTSVRVVSCPLPV